MKSPRERDLWLNARSGAYLLLVLIRCVQHMHQLLQALRPVLRLQDAQERDDVLCRRVSNHHRWVIEGCEHRGLDERGHIGCGAKDEAGIVLEEVSCNRPDAVVLLRHRRENIRKVGDVVRCPCEVVQFLRNESVMKRPRGMNEKRWARTCVMFRWTALFRVSVDSWIVCKISCRPAC